MTEQVTTTVTTKTILVVDDTESNIDMLYGLLEDNYDLLAATSGVDALEIIDEEDNIDLILLDIMMPDMDGYEVCARLKENEKTKDIPVIFITAKSSDDDIEKAYSVGGNDYITKPFKPKELTSRIRRELQIQDLISNLKKFINTQENIVVLTDIDNISFANQSFFDFFGYEDLDHFQDKFRCISDKFVENNQFFHIGKVLEDSNWLEYLEQISHSDRIVGMLRFDFSIQVFTVTVNKFDDKLFIVSFTNITQTYLCNIELQNKTIKDKLTDAYNREYFEQNYQNIITDTYKSNSLLAVAFLDIDHFKLVNDTYGHDVGDDVLVYFVKTIQQYSRDSDILIRWGGEEFILLLKVKSTDGLKKALEHIRSVIENTEFPVVGQKTCSIGGTIYQDGEDIDSTIKRADVGVYQAKESGRNKVVIKLT
jgi:diguanylate cyclase (GGDEF)-like protein